MVPALRGRVGGDALLVMQRGLHIAALAGERHRAARHPGTSGAAPAVVATMIPLVNLIPPSVEPAVVDLAILVPLILGVAAIVLGVSRWHVRWLRGQIVQVLDERLGGLAESVDRVDRAVNHQPDGTPTLAAQVAALTIAGADRASQLAAVARQIAALSVLIRDVSDHLAVVTTRLDALEHPDQEGTP